MFGPYILLIVTFIYVYPYPIYTMVTRQKTKIRYASINPDTRGFVAKMSGAPRKYDFSDIHMIRKLLSREKGRILFTLKKKKPGSIYELAKGLGRDFKSVHDDVKFLERFGFIEFHSEKNGKRESLKPVLIINRMDISIKI